MTCKNKCILYISVLGASLLIIRGCRIFAHTTTLLHYRMWFAFYFDDNVGMDVYLTSYCSSGRGWEEAQHSLPKQAVLPPAYCTGAINIPTGWEKPRSSSTTRHESNICKYHLHLTLLIYVHFNGFSEIICMQTVIYMSGNVSCKRQCMFSAQSSVGCNTETHYTEKTIIPQKMKYRPIVDRCPQMIIANVQSSRWKEMCNVTLWNSHSQAIDGVYFIIFALNIPRCNIWGHSRKQKAYAKNLKYHMSMSSIYVVLYIIL